MGIVQSIIDRCKSELRTSFRLSRRTEQIEWWIGQLSGPEYLRMIRHDALQNLVIQIILMPLSGMILDDGFFSGWVSFSSAAYWSMVLPTLIRKRMPTRFDAIVARFGFLFALAVISPFCLMVLSIVRQ